jgi:hypothetical protein
MIQTKGVVTINFAKTVSIYARRIAAGQLNAPQTNSAFEINIRRVQRFNAEQTLSDAR